MTMQDHAAAATITVRGRVQGVGYRMFALGTASELGLVGTVRNEPDGQTVTIVVEGDRAAIETFAARCAQGPPRAHVEDCHIEWRTPTGQYRDFRIEV
ncbi:MAG: acylphosphatase [Candidatus Kapaibacterium sp.]|nr:MAG: acylphosphatase [Candidatus Kapabacteria bacterium]